MLAEQSASENNGCAWLIAAVIGGGLLFSVSQCDPANNQQTPLAVASAFATDTPTPEPTPTPVLPLSKVSSRHAARDFQRALLEPGSDKVYSENCYLALESAFSWPKLDACAAFDQLVIRWIDSASFDGSSDVDYFAPETAAGRYLAAATSHGQTGDEADQRLANLQDLTAKVRLRVLEPSTSESVGVDDTIGYEATGSNSPSGDNAVQSHEEVD
jgi:hypothetical protein